jgi:hypothetical protein
MKFLGRKIIERQRNNRRTFSRDLKEDMSSH